MGLSKPTPATFALLHLLCRPVLPTDAMTRLDRIEGAVDWHTFVAKLHQYGGSNWVVGHAQSLHLAIPADAYEQLRHSMRKEVARAMLTAAAYQDLMPLLHLESPDVLLLKGRAVETQAYAPQVLRPSNDIDLLIRPGRRAHVEAWLAARGWTNVLEGGDGHANLWHGPGRRGAIDLHDAPLSPFRFRGLTAAGVHRLFDAAIRLDDGATTLDTTAHTALLLAHLHAGVFTDLRHLADLACWLNAVKPSPTAVRTILTGWGGLQCWRAGIAALQRWDRVVLPSAWQAIPRELSWREVSWGPLLHLAWRGSVNGQVEPPHWIRRAALLGHLDAPQAYVLGQLRSRFA